MEQPHDHTSDLNILLAAVAVLMKIFAGLSIGDLMHHIFSALSIISVAMMIVINWKKFTSAIFKKNKKTDE